MKYTFEDSENKKQVLRMIHQENL